MNKLLCIVGVMASLSFGSIIEIGIPVTQNGWDHKNATLAKVHLENYLNDNEVIESAILKFTDVQNLREPETDDILNISLLQLNKASGSDVQLTVFQDGQDNQQSPTNFFQFTSNSSYTWVEGLSNIASYSDNNDRYAYIETKFFPSGTQEVGGGWYYSHFDYAKNMGVWKRIRNYTTENFDRILDVAAVNQLMVNSKGWIGIGLDADCHYTGKVELVITTKNVPEPGTLSFMLFGLTSLTGVFLIRKRK